MEQYEIIGDSRDDYFLSAAIGDRPFFDFEWYAMDKKGQIGMFVSAGIGVVPKNVFSDRTSYENLFHILNPFLLEIN